MKTVCLIETVPNSTFYRTVRLIESTEYRRKRSIIVFVIFAKLTIFRASEEAKIDVLKHSEIKINQDCRRTYIQWFCQQVSSELAVTKSDIQWKHEEIENSNIRTKEKFLSVEMQILYLREQILDLQKEPIVIPTAVSSSEPEESR